MSNFNQLKSMWEQKGKQATQPPPQPKPVAKPIQTKIQQPKIQQPKIQQLKVSQPALQQPRISQPKVQEPKVEQSKMPQPSTQQPKIPQLSAQQSRTSQPKVQQPKIQQLKVSQPKIQAPKKEAVNPNLEIPQIQKQPPRQSVASLKNSLEGVIKFMSPAMSSPYSSGNSNKMPNTDEQAQPEPKRSPQEIQPVKGSERMPTFHESKQNLEKLFDKKKNENAGYQTGVVEASNSAPKEQSFIILNTEQDLKKSKLSPEERTEQIIHRIFIGRERESESTVTISSEYSLKESEGLLTKEEEVTSLVVRKKKKERKTLEDFDEA